MSCSFPFELNCNRCLSSLCNVTVSLCILICFFNPNKARLESKNISEIEKKNKQQLAQDRSEILLKLTLNTNQSTCHVIVLHIASYPNMT
jgi:hypothetical protein